QTVPGEGRRARQVQGMLLRGASRDELAQAGVGWLVVESGSAPALSDLPVVHQDEDLTLYRVGGDHQQASGRGLVVAAHLGWLAALLAGLAGMTVTWARRVRQRR
ncbi:hypothetical protein ABQF26_34580, partial [Mycolicibacterium elephantis]